VRRTIQSKVTPQWLKNRGACLVPSDPGVQWYKKQKDRSPLVLLAHLKAEDHLDWANWLVARLLTPDQCVQYAIFAAESVLYIYEGKYPKDDRPREAIEAAKVYPRLKTVSAAYAAAYAAYAAADAAYAAARTASAAGYQETLDKIIDYGISLIGQKEG